MFSFVYTYNIALDVLVVKKKRTERSVRFQKVVIFFILFLLLRLVAAEDT